MSDRTVPSIFSKRRKRARRERAMNLLDSRNLSVFLFEHMADDVHERLGFLRHPGGDVLIEGYDAVAVAEGRWEVGAEFSYATFADFDEPLDLFSDSFDLVISVNSLDTVNDLPGALIQMRALLKPDGLAMATFVGGASLPKLRRIMLDAEPDRPAARMHPLVDPRSCPQLLARAGWRDPR